MVTVHKISEKELVRGCQKKKPSHQKMLYDRYASTMYMICLRYGDDANMAQDILQEGFVRVFDQIVKYNGGGSLEGWIKRVIVNVALRTLENQSKLYVVSEEEHDEEETGSNTVEQGVTQQELLDVIQSLPAGYRMVFNMYAIEGYSHKEIAEELRITESTSKSQLARARTMLQEMVKDKMQIKSSNEYTR